MSTKLEIIICLLISLAIGMALGAIGLYFELGWYWYIGAGVLLLIGGSKL